MSFSYNPIDVDVIIIGAGVSGVTAALTLLEREPSLDVAILEAEDEIGGRAFFSRNDLNLNCGASWISPNQTSLVDLLEKLEIETKFRTTETLIEYGKTTKITSETSKICKTFEKFDLIAFITRIETLCEKPQLTPEFVSMTMSEFIQAKVRTELVKEIVTFLVWSNCGVSPAEISVAFYVMYCVSTRGILHQLTTKSGVLRQLRIRGGALQICNKMQSLHPNHIVCGQRVKGIISQSRDVKVETTKTHLYCFYVIVAIPPSEIEKINFQPPLLPSKIEAITSSIPGKLALFVVTYAEVFWNVNDIHVLHAATPDRPIICCFDITDNDPSISGYFLASKKDHRSVILKQLAEYLGAKAMLAASFAEKKWETGGPMACVKSLKALHALLEPLDRIFWAGAEASTEWYGTLGGAVHAGQRAALEVLYELRPATLNADDITIIRSPFRRKKDLANYKGFYRTLMKWHITIPASLAAIFIFYKIWRKGWWFKIRNSPRK